ncbi:hypothetical protein NDU88_002856 [Pleurodeles waltl]|uniref:Uncharacterized protein n=1 Tax=Pleurodeles waltl TaxID=8319 RepID=A0AAV7M3N8_PLEWA|nr:hypothetical protein NDU88_002856 [Pleurodeles waltl]
MYTNEEPGPSGLMTVELSGHTILDYDEENLEEGKVREEDGMAHREEAPALTPGNLLQGSPKVIVSVTVDAMELGGDGDASFRKGVYIADVDVGTDEGK